MGKRTHIDRDRTLLRELFFLALTDVYVPCFGVQVMTAFDHKAMYLEVEEKQSRKDLSCAHIITRKYKMDELVPLRNHTRNHNEGQGSGSMEYGLGGMQFRV